MLWKSVSQSKINKNKDVRGKQLLKGLTRNLTYKEEKTARKGKDSVIFSSVIPKERDEKEDPVQMPRRQQGNQNWIRKLNPT